MKRIIFLSAVLGLTAFACNMSNISKDAVVEIKDHKYSVQLADTPEERDLGLSGISSMGDTEGMLFLFSQPQPLKFWMKGMHFPIDIVWVNGNTIVDITENIQPEPNKADYELNLYSPKQDADKALEFNSGWSLRHDVKVGDIVTVTNNK